MAAKTQQTRLSGPEIIEIGPDGRVMDDDADTSGLENDQDRLLDDIIGEFGSGDEEVSYSASVTRIPKNFQRGQKEPWLFECDAADIIGIRTRLRDAYHGGQFRIRVYKITNRGKKLHRQIDYYIETPDTPNTPTGDNKYDALSQMLRETQARVLEMADRLSNPPQQVIPNADPWAQMERMSIIMKNLRGDAPPAATASVKDSLDMFQKGMEIAADMRGSDGDSWFSVLKELVKGLPVGEILENLAKAQAQRNQRPQLPAPQQRPMNGFTAAPPLNNQNSTQSPAATGAELEQSMRYLIGKAQRDADPGLYAEWLLDNSPRQLIRQMANEPNVLQQLALVFPMLNQPNINEWFQELVLNVKQILAQSPETEDNGAGIGPHNEENPHVAGAASFGAPDAGRYPGDQDHPQNHAIPGENGTA